MVQGKNNWNDNLGEKLHEYYDYQANKLIREKLQNNSSKKEGAKYQTSNKTEKINENEKTIYCNAFNKGMCPHEDHHEGRFSNRTVTKWHICSKCYRNGEKRSHWEDQCSNKA